MLTDTTLQTVDPVGKTTNASPRVALPKVQDLSIVDYAVKQSPRDDSKLSRSVNASKLKSYDQDLNTLKHTLKEEIHTLTSKFHNQNKVITNDNHTYSGWKK